MAEILERRRKVSLVTLLLTAALVLAIGVFVGQKLSRHDVNGFDPTTWVLRGVGSDRPRAGSIAVKPSPNLPAIIAQRLRAAITSGDYKTATWLAEEVLAESRPKIWTFYPARDVLAGAFDLNDVVFARNMSRWVDSSPLDATPRLFRSAYYLAFAWDKRGHRAASQTDEAGSAAFKSAVQSALDDVRVALAISPTSAAGLSLRVKILAGYGYSDSLDASLSQAVAVYPDYLYMFSDVLSRLQPKWGGSVDAMYDFVARFSGPTAARSPRGLLPIMLYRYILETANTECRSQEGDAFTTCFDGFMRQAVRPSLEAQVADAIRYFGVENKYETNVAVSDILSEMISISGAGQYAGRLIQIAADSYGVDPRLRQEPAKQNFFIDVLVAKSWQSNQFPDNAMTKYLEAIDHIASVEFPTAQQKDIARGTAYLELASLYSADSRRDQMMEAATKAFALTGNAGAKILLCYGNLRSSRYPEALADCSSVLSDPEFGIEARYYRAFTYETMKEGDKAIADYTVVAASQSDRRVTAAIRMSMIYYDRHENSGSLAVLNRYPFLYDPSVTSKDDVAVAYNNRCYANMEAGELQKALSDCDQSLKFGNIPDAFKKRQELVAKLAR